MSDPKIKEFLQGLQESDPEQFQVVDKLRKITVDLMPQVTERMMYGGIMFTLEGEDFGGLFAYSKHVSFEFSFGAQFTDPQGLLEGKGKLRRHLKYYSLNDLPQKDPTSFLEQVLQR